MRNASVVIPSACRRAALCLLCLVMAAVILSPITAQAQENEKTVRVGWYDSSYNTIDQNGRRTGYAYEYQQKIASYAGWKYEYVSGSWSVLLKMLEEGEIDLMSDVSYTQEREERMLYPSLPMGAEEYYLFIAPGNHEISSSDYGTLNGKRIGSNKDSVQTIFFRDWAEKNGVDCELVEVTSTENESLQMLRTGELDGYVTVDSFVDPSVAVPVVKVGSSDFYFAVSKSRPDLLGDLNAAMSRIQDENRFYNQQMYEKYIRRAGANAFLTEEETAWLQEHGAIRVAYQDNYLAFCAADETSGELTGALKDWLDYASDCFANAHIDFEATAYPTAAEALAALTRGEADCVFPANLGSYEGETLCVDMTPAMVNSDVYAIVRQADQNVFGRKEYVIAAVNEGNPNYDAFLLEHFPRWQRIYYSNTDECLKAVSEGMADCVLVSNYRYNNIARTCEKYRLIPLATGEGMDYCFAAADGETLLYSILAKSIGPVPKSTVSAMLSYYITEDAKLGLSDFIADHLAAVLTVIVLVLAVILFLLFQNIRVARKAQNLIAATETDRLTGLYNRDYFFQYADNIFHAHPQAKMDAIVLNIEQFHTVNALHGREFGDQVLRTLGKEILKIASENGGIGGRFDADRFDIYCRQIEDYPALYDRLQTAVSELAPGENIRLRMGVMPWQEKLEPVQMFDRARTACSMARGNYKEPLIIFDEGVRQREIYEQRLLGDLRRALDSYEFEVYYQPKYDIRSEKPKLVSAEALVRWNHPELGMIPPGDFIPLFERNGQIALVDQYVWEEAAKQIVRWREKYGVMIPVSVNLSRIDVFDPKLEKRLDDILSYNGLEHGALKLEVTESAYTENADQVIEVVRHLREKGYVVEMDDFGTGYSSLNMLSAMPIDVLKMDRVFIRNLGHSEKDAQLVALILGIAKNLKVPVVAEGVETEEQLKLLKDLGCEIVQGYYFSKPLHATDFEDAYIRGAERAPEGR